MIPIYKADTIDDKEVEGYYRELDFIDKNHCIFSNNNSNSHYDINPDTLKISFDGENWYKIDEVALTMANMPQLQRGIDDE